MNCEQMVTLQFFTEYPDGVTEEKTEGAPFSFEEGFYPWFSKTFPTNTVSPKDLVSNLAKIRAYEEHDFAPTDPLKLVLSDVHYMSTLDLGPFGGVRQITDRFPNENVFNAAFALAALRKDMASVGALLPHITNPMGLLSGVVARTGEPIPGFLALLWGASVVKEGLLRTRRKAPIQRAARRGHIKIVRTFLDTYGVNIDTTNESGHTALSEAARMGHVEIVKVLLSRGANPEVASCDGTALDRAAAYGHTKIIEILKEAEGAR